MNSDIIARGSGNTKTDEKNTLLVIMESEDIEKNM